MDRDETSAVTKTEASTLEAAKAKGHKMIPFKDYTLGWERRISHACQTCHAISIVYVVYDHQRTLTVTADGSALTRTCKEIA